MHPLLAPRRLGGHLLALLLVAAAAGLGWWQLEQWRDARADAARDLANAAPVPLDEALGPDQPFLEATVGQPVTVTGTWLPESTVVVSGRERDGQEGYWVATPVAVGSPDGPALYVVRGWTADPTDVPPPPTGAVELVATLQPPEGEVGVVDDDAGDDLVPQLRTADLVQQVEQDLYGGHAVLVDPAASPDGPAAAAGLEPAALAQQPSAGASTALRNVLYAVEWLLFGAFAAFVWWRWTRDVVAAEQPDDGTGPDGPADGPEEPAPHDRRVVSSS